MSIDFFLGDDFVGYIVEVIVVDFSFKGIFEDVEEVCRLVDVLIVLCKYC